MGAGEGQLNAVIQQGDKILPNTATEGRDIIRQELTKARTLWNKLSKSVTERQQQQQSQAFAAKAYADGIVQFSDGLKSVRDQFDIHNETVPDTIEAKKEHLRTTKVLYKIE
jgi:nesprin-1